MPSSAILLVEDDHATMDILGSYIKDTFKTVLMKAFATGEALDQLHRLKPTLLLLDYIIDGLNSKVVADEARKLYKDIPVVLITAYPKVEEIQTLIKPKYLIKKPFALDELDAVLDGEGVPRKPVELSVT